MRKYGWCVLNPDDAWSAWIYTRVHAAHGGDGLARAAGHPSRLAGQGGGTTLPGKLLTAIDPGAIARLANRSPEGSVILSATNGKTTSAAMTSAILASRFRLAHNAAGANLASGVASALVDARDAELLVRGRRAAPPDLATAVRPRVMCLGNLFRDQLDRYGELELIAERWRAMVGPSRRDASRRQRGRSAGGGSRPVARKLGDVRCRRSSQRGATLQHAADSKYCVRCGAPYVYPAAYVGHLGDYRCPSCGHTRPPLDVAARAIESHGIDGISFDLCMPEGTTRVRLQVPGVYNVYNALAAASVARGLAIPPAKIAEGLGRAAPAFGRFERVAVGGKTLIVLLVKNLRGQTRR